MSMAQLAVFPRLDTVDTYAGAQEQFESLRECLRKENRPKSHADIERLIDQRGREVLRALLQGWLDQQASAEVEEPVRDADGQERTHKRRHTRELESIFGTVTVQRTGHGGKRRESLHPLDAQLNLPQERYSFGVRKRAAVEASKGSFDETAATLAEHTGARVGKRQVEELVQRAAQDFDAFYEARQAPAMMPPSPLPEAWVNTLISSPSGAALVACPTAESALEQDGDQAEEDSPTGSLLVISSDGKGIVVRKEDLRERTRKAAEKKKAKMRSRPSRGEKTNKKRMATVAAVYTVAPYVRTPEQAYAALIRQSSTDEHSKRERRPRPENKRVWASVKATPSEVRDEAFKEAHSRDPEHEKKWAAVVDGDPHQLDLIVQAAVKANVTVQIILDLMHVLSYVWKAGYAFYGEGHPDMEPWVLERLLRILKGQAVHVAAGMRRSATLRGLSGSKRKAVDTCAGYLLKYKQYLAYDQYLAAGIPITSGVIEGACRHLVKDRMDLTGARWRLDSAEAVLRLRALRSSHHFEEYWQFHEEREQARNHRVLYAQGQLPAIQGQPDSKQPSLHLVK